MGPLPLEVTGSLDGDKAGGNGLGAAATAGLEVLDGSDAKAEAIAEVATDQAGEEDQPEETAATDDATQGETENLPEAVGGED